MKMKKILKMPLRRLPRHPAPSETLHAKAAGQAESYDEEDYESEEPNMKFSHALIVVLALHVIAVGGVFAFNSIKAGQSAATKPATKSEIAPPAPATAQSKSSVAQAVSESKAVKTYAVQAGDTLSRIAALHKTSIEAIEKENGITSYSMIRVGQLLKIPSPESPTSKSEAAKPMTDAATTATKQAFLATKTDMPKQPAVPAKTESSHPPAVAPKPVAAAAATPKIAHPQPSATKVETPPSTTDGNTYVVAKGDNPYKIAKKLKVSYNELIAINDIKDPTRVQIGQKLKIPSKKN
jgi:LysM repeat protein